MSEYSITRLPKTLKKCGSQASIFNPVRFPSIKKDTIWTALIGCLRKARNRPRAISHTMGVWSTTRCEGQKMVCVLRPRRFQFRSHVSLSNFGAPESGREPLARQRKTAALETGAMFLVLIEMKHERHNHFGTPGGFAGPVPRGGLDPRSPNRRRFLGRGGSGEGPDPPIHSPHGVRIFGGYQ